MIDDGTPRVGTTPLTGLRSLKGWGTCDEDLWPSNLNLSVSEFENWKNIPREAWDDAGQKRIQGNKALATSQPSVVLSIDGRPFRLFTLTTDPSCILGDEGEQIDLTVIDPGFETVAWAQLRAYAERKQIILEELFVKPEFRRAHFGTRLLHRIEQISCLEPVFSKVSNEVLVPIPVSDAGPNRCNAVREFFQKNGYVWKNSDPIRRSPSYSIFTAVKKLDCAEIRNNCALELYG